MGTVESIAAADADAEAVVSLAYCTRRGADGRGRCRRDSRVGMDRSGNRRLKGAARGTVGELAARALLRRSRQKYGFVVAAGILLRNVRHRTGS